LNNPTFEKYFNVKNLKLAWERVLRWTDKTAKDHFGIKSFRIDFDKNLKLLNQKLLERSYKPSRPVKFYVPKSSYMQRTKSMLLIEDAIVYQAIANIIASVAYDKLQQNDSFIFGSVLSPEVKLGPDILDQVDKDDEVNLFFFKNYLGLYKKFADSVNKSIIEDQVVYKFETDITGFFDSISHYNLFELLADEFNVEIEILDLLEKCLNMWAGTREKFTPGIGIPQGAQPSFFFANILLHNLDNLLILDALKYYRYMDDIRIYGFSEGDMIKALIKIDSYLKGFGLALNAKKTNIQIVTNNESDDSIIRFFQYDSESESISDHLNDFSQLAEQDSQDNIDSLIVLTQESDIIDFWKSEKEFVERELPKLFIVENGNTELLKDRKIEDREILNLGYKYRSALRKLNSFNQKVQPSEELLKYWLILLKKYFWRADQICWALYNYKENVELKRALNLLINDFIPYEWFRYQIYLCLSITQRFSAKELQDLFQMLKTEKSYYSRWALYKLLIIHSNNDQFFTSIMREVQREDNFYMKKELLYYSNKVKNKSSNSDQIMEFLGL
jgi:hypothetical protein